MGVKYKRVLLKLSGEALSAGSDGILNFEILTRISETIKKLVGMGVEVSVVTGAGNIWRGRQGGSMERTRADHMGMIATAINSIALQDTLEGIGVPARVLSAVKMEPFTEFYTRDLALKHLNEGRVVIFACGTGNPYFSTDTGAILRAAQINADIALFAKNIDGVYTADPRKDKNAVKIDEITYNEILEKHLAVIDTAATALAMDNNIRILLFGLNDPDNIIKAVTGEKTGTIVYGGKTDEN